MFSVTRPRNHKRRAGNCLVSFQHSFPQSKSIDTSKQRTWENRQRHNERSFVESKPWHDRHWCWHLSRWIEDRWWNARLSVAQLRRAWVHRQWLQTNACPSPVNAIKSTSSYKQLASDRPTYDENCLYQRKHKKGTNCKRWWVDLWRVWGWNLTEILF